MHLVDELLFRHGTEFIDYFLAHHMPPAEDDESRGYLRSLRATLFKHHDERTDRRRPMVLRLNESSSTSSFERQTDP